MKKEYDLAASLYDPLLHFYMKSIRRAVLNELLPYKDKAVLDLCCGTGNQLKLLAKNGFTNLHCLDLSAEMLKIAGKSAYPIQIYNEDATQTHFDEASFDIAMISFGMHEKDKTTQKNLILEIHRLLKKDGLLLIVDFAFDAKTPLVTKIGVSFVERLAGGDHYKNFKAYVRNKGFAGAIPVDKFRLIKNDRDQFKSITLSLYRKCDAS